MRPLLLCLLAVMTSAAEPWAGAVGTTPAKQVDLTVTLADGKTATVRVHHPATATTPCPVVIFSHGLAGSREGYGFLGKRWAEHGYVSIHPDHPGSDTAAFKGKPLAEIAPALKAATQNPEIFAGRPALIRALIDALPQIEQQLPVKLDRERIGVGGHSFGGWTTLAVAGQRNRLPAAQDGAWSDPRPKAFAALSPTGPNATSRNDDLATCTRPMLVMTGSDDRQPAFLAPPGSERSGAWRRQIYDGLPAGDKLLAWFEGSRHSTYSGGAGNGLMGEPPPDPAQVEAVAVITLAWWDAQLRGDEKAKAWLADPATPAVFGAWAKFERK
jgi:predicted dienelactone hydrolase